MRAFLETCRSVDVSPVVERCRSGNGAHVWFFFNEPIPAVLACHMGSALITETMSRRHELMDTRAKFATAKPADVVSIRA